MLSQQLKSICIFQDLDQRSILGISHFFSARVCKAGEDIATVSHQRADEVVALCHGKARMELQNAQGKTLLVRDVKNGELIGDWLLNFGEGVVAKFIAVSDCATGIISRGNFVSLVIHNPQIAQRHMEMLADQIRELTAKFVNMASLPAKARIQTVLRDLASLKDEVMVIEKMPTHQEIATRAHSQREVVVRELSFLRTNGLLVKKDRGFWIPFPEKLGMAAYS